MSSLGKKKIRYFLLCIIFVFLFSCNAMAYDWKALHEKSEKISLNDAKEDVKTNPNSTDDLYVLGLKYMENYQYTEAGDVFNKILSIDPEYYMAEWGRADILRFKHHLDESQRKLNDIIKNHPDFAPAMISLGYIKYLKLQFQDTVELMQKVLSLDGTVNKTSIVMAHGLYAAAKGMMAHYGGPFSKSVNFFSVKHHLKAAEKIDPESFVVYFGYGSFYMSIPAVMGRDLDKAEAFLKKAIEKDPKFPDTYVRLAQIYKKKGDLEKFDKYLSKALELDPQNELANDIINKTCKFICIND